MTIFLDHLIGREAHHWYSGRLGFSLSVLMEGWGTVLSVREGWERTITTQGGVGGGRNSKRYWLKELSLDLQIIWMGLLTDAKTFALSRDVSSFFWHVNRKCHLNTRLKLLLKISRLRSSTVELWVWLLSRLVHHLSYFTFPFVYVITKFIHLFFVIDLIRRKHGISGP